MSEAQQEPLTVKDAIRIAKQYVQQAFADDQITHLALEEVKWDEEREEWLITIGFSWLWQSPQPQASRELSHWPRDVLDVKRTYKLVRISSEGKVLDMSIRTV